MASSLAVAGQTSRKPDQSRLSQFPVRKVWTLDLGHQLSMAPAYSGSHAYFALEGDQIVAYDLTNGRREWIEPARPQFGLVVGGGLVFVVEPMAVRALTTADGRVAWQIPLTATLAASPTWDNGWLILTTREGSIMALRAADGDILWQRDAKAQARVPAALAADRVYVATDDGRITALRIETGAVVWERSVEGIPTGLLALDDRVFVGSTDNFFYCLLADSGKWDWRWRTGGDLVGVPVVDERNVYFASLDNVLRALSKKTGVQQWARPLPLRPIRGPITAGSSLVVTGVAPTLRAYRISDGGAAGEMATGGELAAPAYAIPSSPVPMLLVVTRDLANGATATLIRRQVEPTPTPLVPLANPVKLPDRIGS